MRFYIFSSAETTPDWLSNAITKSLKTDYSHVGVIVDEDIYHSNGDGVNKKTIEEFLADHKFVHKLEITRYVGRPAFAEGWCVGNIGKDYSESQYLGIIIPALRRMSGDGRAEMICSEFAARFIDECTAIPSFDRSDCDFIDPKTLIEKLLTYTGA